jgi:hypothetical protein
VDYYWDRLSAGGQEIACGWLKGLRWLKPTSGDKL